jgi:hypothetical protein
MNDTSEDPGGEERRWKRNIKAILDSCGFIPYESIEGIENGYQILVVLKENIQTYHLGTFGYTEGADYIGITPFQKALPRLLKWPQRRIVLNLAELSQWSIFASSGSFQNMDDIKSYLGDS